MLLNMAVQWGWEIDFWEQEFAPPASSGGVRQWRPRQEGTRQLRIVPRSALSLSQPAPADGEYQPEMASGMGHSVSDYLVRSTSTGTGRPVGPRPATATTGQAGLLAGDRANRQQHVPATPRVAATTGGVAPTRVNTLPALAALTQGIDIPQLAGKAAAILRELEERDKDDEQTMLVFERALGDIVLIHRVLRSNLSWKGEKCIICYSNVPDTVLKPCGHGDFCRVGLSTPLRPVDGMS